MAKEFVKASAGDLRRSNVDRIDQSLLRSEQHLEVTKGIEYLPLVGVPNASASLVTLGEGG